MGLPLLLWGLLLSLHAPSCSAAGETDTLSGGHALAGDEKLISGNGKFALGFFPKGSKSSSNTVNSYLGIWFNKVPELTPVWTANGPNPVSALASPKLMISGDGNLILSAQDTVVWSSQANITTNNTVVALLGNGNLVLRSSSNSSDVFWQSFDYPTDTLLPGAKLGQNKVTGMIRRIVSRKNSMDQAPGVYSNELGLDETMRLSWKLSTEYWNSGKWNGRFFDSLPFMSPSNTPGATQKPKPDFVNHTLINNNQEIYFTDTLTDENTILQVMLTVSGQWKIRIWDVTHQVWLTPANKPENQCDVYAVCGAFTTCSYDATPFCRCMEGFSIRSPEDWELEDRTGGCIRNTPLDCRGSDKNGRPGTTTDKFLPMPHIRLPANGRGIQNATDAQSCSRVCLSDCSCTSYSYTSKDGCFIWHDELINVVEDDSGETLNLRLAAKELQNRGKYKYGIIIGVTVSVSTVALCLIVLTVIFRSRKWSGRGKDSIGIVAFRYADIRHATKNFSEKLGGGSFGSVFKGCLSDSVAIAVKILQSPCQGEKQFRAEVSSIGIIHHVNLVKLIGFCCEGDRRLLVYEHMANGSLDARIFQSHGTILDWDTRYHVALGVARGLAYLHHSCQECIIHCDVKPENILLDESFTAKVADFGMAKFLGRNFSRAVTTMRGTVGYLAPEWISGTAITSKVDVYSYGMVLLEIISGRRNFGKQQQSLTSSHDDDDEQKGCFPVRVVSKLLEGDVGALVDEKLHGRVNLEEVERACRIACWCIQDNEFDRPTMGDVVQCLLGIFEPSMPPMPKLLYDVFGGLRSCA